MNTWVVHLPRLTEEQEQKHGGCCKIYGPFSSESIAEEYFDAHIKQHRNDGWVTVKGDIVAPTDDRLQYLGDFATARLKAMETNDWSELPAKPARHQGVPL